MVSSPLGTAAVKPGWQERRRLRLNAVRIVGVLVSILIEDRNRLRKTKEDEQDVWRPDLRLG